MFNSAKFSLAQVKLECNRVKERHHNQLQINHSAYTGSREMNANIAIMDALGETTLALESILFDYERTT